VEPVRLGVLGAGAQARWQTRAIDALTDVESVSVYSPSDSKHDCASDLGDHGIDASAVESPEAAVEDANVVVTATTSTDPVFPAAALQPGTLVVAVGSYNAEMQELEPAVFDRAARVFADVPEEVAGIGDLLSSTLEEGNLIPFSEVREGPRAARATRRFWWSRASAPRCWTSLPPPRCTTLPATLTWGRSNRSDVAERRTAPQSPRNCWRTSSSPSSSSPRPS